MADYKLNAINSMLRAIGEKPVNSLSNVNANLDLASALQTLDDIDGMVQEEGWNFNTEALTLSPDTSGNIILPANCLKADTTGTDQNIQVTTRGNRLYNKDENTFQFEHSLEIEVVLRLTFNDLPASARRYISSRAGYEFVAANAGDSTQYAYTREAVAEARTALELAESEGQDVNILESNSLLAWRGRF